MPCAPKPSESGPFVLCHSSPETRVIVPAANITAVQEAKAGEVDVYTADGPEPFRLLGSLNEWEEAMGDAVR